MLESEKSSLAGRVHDLERRVLTQQDEIVCLRSTLADVLRRLNQFEGNIERSAHNSNNNLNIQGGRSAPNTPSRNGTLGFNRSKYWLTLNSNKLDQIPFLRIIPYHLPSVRTKHKIKKHHLSFYVLLVHLLSDIPESHTHQFIDNID